MVLANYLSNSDLIIDGQRESNKEIQYTSVAYVLPSYPLLITDIATILWESYNPSNPNTLNMPIGWDIVATTDEIKNKTNLFGLKSIAAQCTYNDEICIAFAGTNLWEYNDIIDDLRLIFALPTYKIEAIKYFIKHIAEKVGGLDALLKLDIIFCGHSLGAELAEISMLLIDQLKHDYQDVISGKLNTITIENPGSHSVLKYLLSKGMFPAINEIEFNKLAENTVAYHNKPNFVNTLGTQFTYKNTYLLVKNKDPIKVTVPKIKDYANNISNCGTKFLEYIEQYISYALLPIKKCYSLFLAVEEIFKDHGLTSYINGGCFFLPVEQFKAPNNQMILHNNVLPFLKNITSTGKDIAIVNDDTEIYSDCGSFRYVKLYQYGYKDLELIGLSSEDLQIYNDA